VLLTYTHYLAVIPLFLEFAFIIFFKLKTKNYKECRQIIITYLFHFVLYIPQIIAFYINVTKSAKNGTWLGTPQFEDLYNIVRKFANEPVPAVIFIALIIVALFIKNSNSVNRCNLNFFYFAFFVPHIGIFILSQYMPIYHDKYLIYLSPFYYLIVAISTVKIVEKVPIKFQILVTIILLFPFSISFNIREIDAQNLKKSLIKSKNKTQAFIVIPVWYKYNFMYYYGKEKYFSNSNLWQSNRIENIAFCYNLQEVIKPDYISKNDTINIIFSGQSKVEMSQKLNEGLPSIYVVNFISEINEKAYLVQVSKRK